MYTKVYVCILWVFFMPFEKIGLICKNQLTSQKQYRQIVEWVNHNIPGTNYQDRTEWLARFAEKNYERTTAELMTSDFEEGVKKIVKKMIKEEDQNG